MGTPANRMKAVILVTTASVIAAWTIQGAAAADLAAQYDAQADAFAGNSDQPFSSTVGPDIVKTVSVSSQITGPGIVPLILSRGSAITTVDSQYKPFVEANVTGDSILSSYETSGGGSSSSQLSYEFEIFGPTATVPVLIQAQGYFNTSPGPNAGAGDAGGGADGYISLDVEGKGLTIFDEAGASTSASPDNAIDAAGTGIVSGSPVTGYMGSINDNTSALLYTGQIYNVFLTAGAVASSISYDLAAADLPNIIGGPVFANAFLDPYFSIAPGTPNADQYSLIFSPGVGNLPLTTAVPEPSTWAMLLIGFAGLGFAALNRPRKSGIGSLGFSSPIG